MTEPHRDLTIFGEADDKTVEQMYNCLDVQSGSKGVLCADNHLGYAQPVGGVVAYRNRISVSGVGYDIGCGNKAVETNLAAADVDIAGVKVVKTIIPGPFCSPFRHPVWWWKMRHMRADIRAMEKENELSPLPLHIKRAIERAEHDAFLNGGGA